MFGRSSITNRPIGIGEVDIPDMLDSNPLEQLMRLAFRAVEEIEMNFSVLRLSADFILVFGCSKQLQI
jgi:hypothetical protein